MNSSPGNQGAIAPRLGSISGIWRANRIISRPPFSITIRSLSLSLAMEKRSGRTSLWHRSGVFRRNCIKPVGTGLSDEVAATLPIPKKDELLSYLRASYEAIECFIESLDTKYPNFDN